MYGDIYFRLSPAERNSLELYHKRVNESQNKPAVSTPKVEHIEKSSTTHNIFSKESSSPVVSSLTPKTNSLQHSFFNTKNRVSLKKTLVREPLKSLQNKDLRYSEMTLQEKSNISYEYDKILRFIHKHAAHCPVFKAEVSNIKELLLLDKYFKYKDVSP